MLVEDPETGDVYWEQGGEYFPVAPNEVEPLMQMQADNTAAKDMGSFDAGITTMADRVLNAVNTFIPESWEPYQRKVMGSLKGTVPFASEGMPDKRAMNAVKREHPIAAGVGDTLPYVFGAPAAATGVLPMLAVGTGMPALLADKGDEARDAAIGLVTAGTGSVTGSIANKVAGSAAGRTAKKYYKNSIKELEKGVANNVPEDMLAILKNTEANAKSMKKLYAEQAKDTPTLLKQASASRLAIPGLLDYLGDSIIEERQ